MTDKDAIKLFFNEKAPIWDDICFHDKNKLDEILRICDIKQGEKVIDVGCGTGVFTKRLIETKAKQIMGIDLSYKMIEIAKSKIINNRVTFIADDFYEFCDNDFDCIIIYSAYPHFLDKARFVKKISSLLKTGGRFIIAHSQSKEEINSCHNKRASNISLKLQEPKTEFEYFEECFEQQVSIDNDEMYLLSGVKKQCPLDK